MCNTKYFAFTLLFHFRSQEMETSFDAGNKVNILLEKISLSNDESNNETQATGDQKETLSQNIQSSKTNIHGQATSVKVL